jgi:hypothetical protein
MEDAVIIEIEDATAPRLCQLRAFQNTPGRNRVSDEERVLHLVRHSRRIVREPEGGPGTQNIHTGDGEDLQIGCHTIRESKALSKIIAESRNILNSVGW